MQYLLLNFWRSFSCQKDFLGRFWRWSWWRRLDLPSQQQHPCCRLLTSELKADPCKSDSEWFTMVCVCYFDYWIRNQLNYRRLLLLTTSAQLTQLYSIGLEMFSNRYNFQNNAKEFHQISLICSGFGVEIVCSCVIYWLAELM